MPQFRILDPKIPVSNTSDPLELITDDAQIAQWNNEGLPSDRMSAENATILTNSARWPLMIDPQLYDYDFNIVSHVNNNHYCSTAKD